MRQPFLAVLVGDGYGVTGSGSRGLLRRLLRLSDGAGELRLLRIGRCAPDSTRRVLTLLVQRQARRDPAHDLFGELGLLLA